MTSSSTTSSAPDRGRLTIFLGMAAGVGKTYRMLQEGHARVAAGEDVVVGLLETHGRTETQALAVGLEILPRRRVSYRGATLEELDVPAVLTRAPELCLIDELAHTNAAGLEHAKRFQDVSDVLAAGIDVLSTVNVQHLESLNDRIAELSGVRVRETIPDQVVTAADEVILIDLPPEALIDRLRSGRVYPQARIESALNGFFRVENLAALREVALRQVAEQVEVKRLTTDEPLGTRGSEMAGDAHQAVGERLLALIEPVPGAQRLVRRAWRSAERLGADLDLLWIRPAGRAEHDDELPGLSALRQLASVLGARLLIEDGEDVAATAARVARERGTTYILMGRSHPRRGLARLRTPLPQRIAEALPGVDVRIVADRASRTPAEGRP